RFRVAPEPGIERVANKIDDEDPDRESAPPLGVARESNCGQTARSAYNYHPRDRWTAADLLKLNARFRLQSPDRFQKTSGKCQRERRDQTDQSARRKEDHE